nr:regulator of Vps4 activity in the MVB pathway protein [Tanacetum cinerariifolium]
MKLDKLLSHYCRKPTHTPSIPTRSGSLPAGSVATPVPIDGRKGLARVATYQPNTALSPQGHVHPKLPDYDHLLYAVMISYTSIYAPDFEPKAGQQEILEVSL